MMFKQTLMLALVAMMSGLLCGDLPAQAEADGPDYFMTTDKNVVPMYVEKSAESSLLLRLLPATKGLKNLGCQSETTFDEWPHMDEEQRAAAWETAWCKVSYNGLVGWVQQKFLYEYTMPNAPTFACGGNLGEVESLICKDPELMLLDHQMADVYDASRHSALSLDAGADEAAKELQATQIGWIGGRNECWKQPDDVKACTKRSYEERIAYLQTQWMLIEPKASQWFSCTSPADEVVVTYFDTSTLPSVAVEYGDNRKVMLSSPAASGSRYDGEFGQYIWVKGPEALFVWDQFKSEKSCHQTNVTP